MTYIWSDLTFTFIILFCLNYYTGKDQVKKPQVSVYPVSRPQANGKRVLLCQASGMFPDLVRFTWQAEDQSGRKVELKDDEQLEQRDKDQEVQITSMLIVDQHKAMNNNFTCSVQHDSSFANQIIIIPRVEDNMMTKPCKMPKEEEEESEKSMTFGVFELRRNLHLFSMTYVTLLVKNVLYFCTVSVLLCRRNAAIQS